MNQMFKYKFLQLSYFLILSILLLSCTEEQQRERQSFNQDWKFNKGETGNEFLASFDDTDWRNLNLPHDWAIEGPFDSNYDTRTGGLPIYGTAWYRKHFVIDANQKGKTVTVEFDGVMNNAEVYLNGEKVGARPYGYIGFQLDLTPHIKFGEENVLAVRVNPKELSARWYPGAGIYRNVWLEIKNQVHFAHWGTYITTPEVSNEKAQVNIETTIENKDGLNGRYSLETIILNAAGT
jgi:beta-galactosidase